MNRIFISYKRVDKDRVFEIRDLIESHIGKDECWIDLDGIESDAQFKNVIIHAIKNCEVVLFMYSKTHAEIRDFENDWTVKELNFASAKRKRIVFVNIDGTPLTDEFSFDFGLKQQIDGKSTEALERLIKDLHKWLDIPVREPNQFNKTTRDEDPEELFNKDRNCEPSGAYTNAVKYYRKAAEQGYASAQNDLGRCYYDGQGVTQDYAEAVKWYRKAADQGYAYAQCNLGVCYFYGRGVSQDYAEAVKWYRKAAKQGLARAQNNLGNCYYEGQSVVKDYAEAFKWYHKAAEQNDANAQYNLGVCYYNGQGVARDYDEARKWFELAAQQGDKNAKSYCKLSK